jgi:hypothetical protein
VIDMLVTAGYNRRLPHIKAGDLACPVIVVDVAGVDELGAIMLTVVIPDADTALGVNMRQVSEHLLHYGL